MPVYSYEIKYGELKFEIEDLPPGNSCSASITARNQIGTSQPTDITFGKTYRKEVKFILIIPTPVSSHTRLPTKQQ